MSYNESAENYLETILILSKALPVVRSVDVATKLNFKKSSVSVAMKHLREKNHITVTEAGFTPLPSGAPPPQEWLLSSWQPESAPPSYAHE